MDTKNVIAAISLSAAVIILYSLFFAPAVVDQKDISNDKNITSENSSTDAPSLVQDEETIKISRNDALKENERVLFENDKIKGSISLIGSSIDDLTFKNYTNTLNGDDNEQVNKAFDAVLTPPFGEGYRIVSLKNNPIFTAKNEDLRIKFEKIHGNIPQNTYFILQNTKKPDSRLKSTKFLQKLIKNNLAKEKSFSLPEIWDYEGQKRFLEDAANEMNIKLDKNAAELIIDSVGNDSFKLINELAKAKT